MFKIPEWAKSRENYYRLWRRAGIWEHRLGYGYGFSQKNRSSDFEENAYRDGWDSTVGEEMNLGDWAHATLKAFLKELAIEALAVERMPDEDWDGDGNQPTGSYAFLLKRKEHECLLLVPCVPPDEAKDDVFIRFDVDGSSWMWKYAISQTRHALGIDDEDEE